MKINGDGLSQGLRFRPQGRVTWQQAQAARLVEIFNDREGLRKTMPVNIQYRDQTLGVACQMVRSAVRALQQMTVSIR